jgi:hypothetical protein
MRVGGKNGTEGKIKEQVIGNLAASFEIRQSIQTIMYSRHLCP